MEPQTILVNQHIDDLRQTAREVRATGPSESASALYSLRHNVGWRLVSLGLMLISPGQAADRPIARMA